MATDAEPGDGGGDPGDAQDRATRIRRGALVFRLAVLAVLIVAVVFLQQRLRLFHHLAPSQLGHTVDRVRDAVHGLGIWGPPVFVCVCAVGMVINIPAFVAIVLSVVLFGYLAGGALSFVIVAAGTTLIYAVAQWLGRPLVQASLGRFLERIEERLSQRELFNVIAIRLVFFMRPAVNWLLCVSGVRYRNLLAGTLVGGAPGILINVWLAGVVVDLAQQGRSLNPLKTPQLLIPLLLGVLLLAGVHTADRRRRRSARGAVSPHISHVPGAR